MILSHQRQFIFVRTIKTAGSSLEMVLAKLCGPNDILTPVSPEEEEWRQSRGYRGPQNTSLPWRAWTPGILYMRVTGRRPAYYNHMPASLVRRAVGRTVWSEYFTFAVERNPWDRIVSQYFWRTRDMDPRPSAGEYLRSLRQDEISNFHLYGDGNSPLVDRVLRYETLAADLQHVSREHGWPELDELPHAKGYTRPAATHYRKVLSDDDRLLVAQACSREIALLEYEF